MLGHLLGVALGKRPGLHLIYPGRSPPFWRGMWSGARSWICPRCCCATGCRGGRLAWRVLSRGWERRERKREGTRVGEQCVVVEVSTEEAYSV